MKATEISVGPDWALTSFDPWERALNRSNIWDIYRAMRNAGPVVRSDARGGFYSVTTFNEIREAAMAPDIFSSGLDGTLIGKSKKNPRAVPLEVDPPEHKRFRKPMFETFSPKKIKELEPMVARHVSDILDEVEGRESVDVVSDIATEIPFRIISDIIGFDQTARATNKRLSLAVIDEKFDAKSTADANYVEFLKDEVEKNFKHPSGLLGHLAQMAIDTDAFAKDELVGMARALGLAGFHTTINGIVAVLIRAADADVRGAYLGGAPELKDLVAFVEETIRIDPPIHLEGRTTTQDTTLGGVGIPAGSTVALVYASGNHDDSKYVNPESFTPGRNEPHLGFGFGTHACLGNLLARMEMRTVLREILRRSPNYSLLREPEDAGMVFGHHMGWESASIRM